MTWDLKTCRAGGRCQCRDWPDLVLGVRRLVAPRLSWCSQPERESSDIPNGLRSDPIAESTREICRHDAEPMNVDTTRSNNDIRSVIRLDDDHDNERRQSDADDEMN